MVAAKGKLDPHRNPQSARARLVGRTAGLMMRQSTLPMERAGSSRDSAVWCHVAVAAAAAALVAAAVVAVAVAAAVGAAVAAAAGCMARLRGPRGMMMPPPLP